MKNYEVTKIQLLGLIEGILDYTSNPNIRIPCNTLKEGIEENKIKFEVFEYCCETIAEWYSKEINSITQNEYVYNKSSHIDNKKIIEDIVKDIDDNKDEYMKLLASPRIKKENPGISENEIFIVHGHDNGLKNEVARFLEKMGFESIILHEQASSGDTIIEKIERYSNVGFGIVLYTACDVGNSFEERKNLKPRARQNVIFEHGYLIGKLGRKNVVALVKDNVERPNDISGVVYINYTDEEAWKIAIVKELKAAGYNVDLNLLIK